MRASFPSLLIIGLSIGLSLLCGCPSQPVSAPVPEKSAPSVHEAPPVSPAPPPLPAPLPLLGRLLQPAPQILEEGPVYAIGSLPLVPPDLPAGPGKELVQSFCAACHSLRYIAMQPPLSAKQWTASVDKMIKTYGAVVPDEVRPQILSYLTAHFSSDSQSPAAGARP